MSKCDNCPNREGNKCIVFNAPVCDKTLITCLEHDLYNWDDELRLFIRAFKILEDKLEIKLNAEYPDSDYNDMPISGDMEYTLNDEIQLTKEEYSVLEGAKFHAKDC